ncbi:MAG TPA: zinc ribbon domain-containing protein [Solirubrobacteraceae bacterium]|nr:zinc ribbon domain-containing protein [Solirubrobacteraceae bacterium]
MGELGHAVETDRPGALGADSRTALRQRRDALAEEVIELHWDLGGLAYEMAIRDHFRLDVLVRRAALLQERDAELAEVERLLAMEDTATIGDCPQCGAPHSRGAVFCWQCGVALMERSAPVGAGPEGAGAASASAREAADGQIPADAADATHSAVARPSASESAADDATAVIDRLLAPSAPSREGASSATGISSRPAPFSGSRPSSPPSSTPDR